MTEVAAAALAAAATTPYLVGLLPGLLVSQLQTELDDLTCRQLSYDHRDSKASSQATDITDKISGLDLDITSLTTPLAARSSAYRRVVDLHQIVVQVAELKQAKTEVTARRAVLPSEANPWMVTYSAPPASVGRGLLGLRGGK